LTREVEGVLLLGGEPSVVLRQAGEGMLAQGVRPLSVPVRVGALGQKVAGQAKERIFHVFDLVGVASVL